MESVILNQSDMELYACAKFVLFSAYELLIKSTNNGYGKEKLPIWEFFSVAEESRFAKCKKCNIEVPHGGQSTKTFTPTNLVHHLKTKPGHEEEYERYNKLKTEEKKKQSSTTDGTQLRQVSLQETPRILAIYVHIGSATGIGFIFFQHIGHLYIG